MAKFCGVCGAQMDDAANVCGTCGAVLNQTPKTATDSAIDAAKKAQIKKYAILGGIAAAALAIIIVAIVMVVKLTGYRGLLRKTLNAYESYDLAALVEMTSEARLMDDDDVEDYYRSVVDGDMSFFDNRVGHDYDLSFETKEVYVMDKRMQEKTENRIESYFPDYDLDVIDKIVGAEIIVTAKQGKKSVETSLEITLVKEDGNWVIMFMD